MISLFAQTAIPQAPIDSGWLQIIAIGLFILAGGAVLGFLVQAVTLVKILRGDAEKRDVTVREGFAEKSELKAVENKLQQFDADSEARSRRLHQRIDPLVENTAHIKGEMEAFRQSFDNFAVILTAQHKERK